MREEPKRIGRFDIVRRLGRGGMGVVYQARDTRLGDRLVAIKLLRRDEDATDEAVKDLAARIVNEARAAGQIRSDHVVQIFDVGEHEGEPFIAMEFIDGDTLATLIKRREPLTLDRKLELMLQLCEGAAAAHECGIIHRDIKPPNLFVERKGRLKILDFGVAKVAGATIHTVSGAVMGTLNYASPEQIWAKRALDKRSDIFSIGAVFYELLSYRPAFPGTMPGIVHKILHESPEPLESLGVPEQFGLDAAPIEAEISRIVWRALAKDPDDRYQTLDDLVADIVEVRRKLSIDARPAPRGSILTATDVPLSTLTATAATQSTGTPAIDATPKASSIHELPNPPRAGVPTQKLRELVADAIPSIDSTAQRVWMPAPEAPAEGNNTERWPLPSAPQFDRPRFDSPELAGTLPASANEEDTLPRQPVPSVPSAPVPLPTVGAAAATIREVGRAQDQPAVVEVDLAARTPSVWEPDNRAVNDESVRPRSRRARQLMLVVALSTAVAILGWAGMRWFSPELGYVEVYAAYPGMPVVRWWSVGAEALYSSRDAGASWQSLEPPVNASLLNIRGSRPVIGNLDGLVELDPSGAWRTIPPPADGPMFQDSIAISDSIVAQDLDGRLWVRDGSTWSQRQSVGAGAPTNVHVVAGRRHGNALVLLTDNQLVSFDTGASWQNLQLPDSTWTINAAVVQPSEAQTATVLVLADGKLWSRVYQPQGGLPTQPWEELNLNTAVVHLSEGVNAIWASGFNSIWASHDSGRTWSEAPLSNGYIYITSFAADPGRPDQLYVGLHGAILTSGDAAKTWSCHAFVRFACRQWEPPRRE